jgi:hypothetical protein
MVNLKRCHKYTSFCFAKGGEIMARKPVKPKNVSPRLECLKCSKDQPVLNFYTSNSDLHSKTGKFPICKSCLKQNIDVENIESVKDMLLQMNRPFLYDQWDSAVDESIRTGKECFGLYLKTVQLNFKNHTWKDSVFIQQQPNVQTSTKDPVKSTTPRKSNDFQLTDDLIDKWGDGYTPEEIRAFERKYSKLINNYGEKTALHTEGLLTYIRYRVKEEMATAANQVREAKEWGTLASKAAQDAKINVSQLSKSDISGGVDVLSQLFEAVESEVGVIPLLPHLLEQPYDDADMVIWATVNYNRRLEDKPAVPYRDIWTFYDEMLGEYFSQQGFNEDQVEDFKSKRNNVFRDLSQIYKEPLYESDGE